LDVRLVGPNRFAIIDALGNASLPFSADNSGELCEHLKNLANITPVTPSDSIFPLSSSSPEKNQTTDLKSLHYRMEGLYVSSIPDKYRIWLCGTGDWSLFDAKKYVLPIAYLECGYGAGNREFFEQIHTRLPSLIPQDFLTKELWLA